MLNLFKRKRSKTSSLSWQSNRFSSKLDKQLRRLAAYLDKQYTSLSITMRSFLLVLFCLISGVASSFIIFSAFTTHSNTMEVKRVTIPGYVVPQGDSALSREVPILSEKVLRNIQRFRHYMDSLKQSESGKLFYDSIMQARPGLMDSLLITEQLYNHEIKTK